MPKVNDDYPNQEKISDQELKERAIANYKTNAPKESKESEQPKFPTEIVDLPSKGLLYPEGHPLTSGQVEMKYMSAREEDILTTQSYIKQGVVLDKLFRALIVGNGKGEKINYNDILVGDKNAIMIAARVLGYGKEYEFEIVAPSGEKQKESIDLTMFDDKEIDWERVTKGSNEFEFTLPASKRLITYKMLNHSDTKKIEEELKAVKKFSKRSGYGDSELTTRLIHTITSIDGERGSGPIRNFVQKEMLAIDSKALRTEITNTMPDIDLTIELYDNLSDEPFEVDLPIDTNFFWPRA
tara:strand:- start:949 stop:1839 length:891 start_codon:yes stop_codon:yes gene_type:complete